LKKIILIGILLLVFTITPVKSDYGNATIGIYIFNNTAGSKCYDYGDGPPSESYYPWICNVTCNITTGDAGATLNLYRNDTIVATGTDSVSENINLPSVTGGTSATVYNYSCMYEVTENYTQTLKDRELDRYAERVTLDILIDGSTAGLGTYYCDYAEYILDNPSYNKLNISITSTSEEAKDFIVIYINGTILEESNEFYDFTTSVEESIWNSSIETSGVLNGDLDYWIEAEVVGNSNLTSGSNTSNLLTWMGGGACINSSFEISDRCIESGQEFYIQWEVRDKVQRANFSIDEYSTVGVEYYCEHSEIINNTIVRCYSTISPGIVGDNYYIWGLDNYQDDVNRTTGYSPTQEEGKFILQAPGSCSGTPLEESPPEEEQPQEPTGDGGGGQVSVNVWEDIVDKLPVPEKTKNMMMNIDNMLIEPIGDTKVTPFFIIIVLGVLKFIAAL